MITEVPLACFSSAAFGEAARPQVAGVAAGDEIALINGEPPRRLAERICASGDPLNACAVAKPPHSPGDQGKLAADPCISCDFHRRHREHSLDVALQMWIRAVKGEKPIVLGVRSHGLHGAAAGGVVVAAGAAESAAKRKPSGALEGGALRAAKATKTSPKASAGAPPSATPPGADAPSTAAEPKPVVRYNPLRPAAVQAAAAGVPITASAPAASAKTKPVRYAVVKPPGGGLQYEERRAGDEGGRAVKAGQEVEVKFFVRTNLAGGKEKVMERGEVRIRVGDGEVLDGWVDGNVDMEEVLGSWSRSLIGMRRGELRRIHIPPGKGFRERGGDDLGEQSSLFFDAEIQKLL